MSLTWVNSAAVLSIYAELAKSQEGKHSWWDVAR